MSRRLLSRPILLALLALAGLSSCTRSASEGVAPLPGATFSGGGAGVYSGTSLSSSPVPGATRSSGTSAPPGVPTPRPTATLVLPSGTPMASWKGIPVLPGALAAEDLGYQYEFTIAGELLAVLEFYRSELSELGWRFDRSGTGYQGEPLLTFKKGAQVLAVAVSILSPEKELLLVTLAFP